jgi:galactonate dehydratase
MVDAHYGVLAPHSAQGLVCSAGCAGSMPPAEILHPRSFDEFNEPREKEIDPVEVVDGDIEIPERPGLGVDPNSALI